MPRPQSPDPTDGELMILRVLWNKGACSIGQFQEELAKARPMGYTTVQSNLLTMIDKGYIRRNERRGKIVTYSAIINEEQTKERLVKRLAEKLFGGSVQKMLSYASGNKKLSKDSISSLKKKVDETA